MVGKPKNKISVSIIVTITNNKKNAAYSKASDKYNSYSNAGFGQKKVDITL